MSNVICAGREEFPRRGVVRELPSCGWHGTRAGLLNYRHALQRYEWLDVNLTKPCPRCNGRVELIDPNKP